MKEHQKVKCTSNHKYIHEGGKCSHAVQREDEEDIREEVQGLHEVDLGEKVALLEKVQAI